MNPETTTRPFRFEASTVQKATVVTISVSLADEFVPLAKARFLEILKEKPKRLILDLAQVEDLSSSGITLLLSILRRCCQINCWFALCGLNHNIAALFKLTRLNKVFNIFPDRKAAQQAH
ncbi:MAG: STAS domain-containing protein [Planctomycetes bacterium]|nr:STAS domain-containing protein [Planctomycetota bacterium]